jgi:transcriptional regulator with XRE-family HTH domain
MDDDNVAIRLKGFIESEGLTNSQFADRAGIPRPSLSQLLTGRNKKISDVLVGQIHKAFPDLSVIWLLFGEGEMLVSAPGKEEKDDDALNLFSDEENFLDDDTEMIKKSNLNALNTPRKPVPNRMNSEIEEDLRIVELQRQIDKMKRNPRKVSHITVYYDDSTFETFYPRR